MARKSVAGLTRNPPLSLVRVKLGALWVPVIFDHSIGRIRTFLPPNSTGVIDTLAMRKYAAELYG